MKAKIYRFVTRTQYQNVMLGIFRNLKYEEAGVPKMKYEKALAPFMELSLPQIPMHPEYECWFTELGKEKFEPFVENLLCLYTEYNRDYIVEWDRLESEVNLYDTNIVKYKDTYQVVLDTSSIPYKQILSQNEFAA